MSLWVAGVKVSVPVLSRRFCQTGTVEHPHERIMRQQSITARRQFLKNCLASAVLVAAGDHISLPDAPAATPLPAKSRVVIADDSRLRGPGSALDSTRVQSLLDRTMEALFQVDRAEEAWKKVVRPGQTVGLKVNSLGGRGLSSNLQLLQAVCERLQQAGIRAADIVIWDRDTEEMERAGFHIATGGNRVQCFGTDRVGYEDDLVNWGSVGSRLSKVLTRRCDVLINVPVLKDHDGAGVTIALKNMYGAIHNPNKYHPHGCDPYIADLNMLPQIRGKMALTLCDATTACYEGGPAFKPEYSWQANRLIASRDPVALDTTGWQMIERMRAEKGLTTLEADGRPPRYLATAADSLHRLGANDAAHMEKVQISLA